VTQLRDTVLSYYYEGMDAETRALISLRKVYWPVQPAGEDSRLAQ
jgi:hypothetical protein